MHSVSCDLGRGVKLLWIYPTRFMSQAEMLGNSLFFLQYLYHPAILHIVIHDFFYVSEFGWWFAKFKLSEYPITPRYS